MIISPIFGKHSFMQNVSQAAAYHNYDQDQKGYF